MDRKQPTGTTMRLSEAIRLGAMLGSQTCGAFFRKRGDEVATCALGAAIEALGAKDKGLYLSFTTWPILNLQVPEKEVPPDLRMAFCRRPLQTLSSTIMELNDRAKWTRTQIADWVEEFERRHLNEDGGDNGHTTASVRSSSPRPEEGGLVVCSR